MKVELEVPDYRPEEGIVTEWDPDYEIEVRRDASGVAIRANAAGLRTLARHLITLASSSIPAGSHLHYDDSNGLAKDSVELILERS
jgi:hypothetical protein